MALHFILDGYNLIKKTPALLRFRLKEGREALVRLIEKESLKGSERNQMTIVFDGQAGVWGGDAGTKIKSVFTSDESADDRIKKIVEEAKDRKNIVVVTDDREIRFYIRALGARPLSVAEFLGKVKDHQDTTYPEKAARPRGERKQISSTQEYNITSEFEKIWLQDKKGKKTK